MANTKVTGDLIASSTIATGNIADNAVTSDKISGITTAHITEGANLYYTDARARAAVSVSGNALSYNSSTGVITSNFEEAPTFTGVVTASRYVATGQNLSHGASRLKISQENTTLSEIRFYGADTSTAGALRFMGSSSDGSTGDVRMTIDSSGRLGIGTTSPAKKLEVATTGINQSSTIRIQGTDGNGNGHPLDLKMNGADDSFSILIGQGGGATPSTILFNGNRNGNVGIGQAPSSFANWRIFEIKGLSNGSLINFENSSSTRTGAIAMNDASSLMRFQTFTDADITFEANNSERMRVTGDGKVGIGTTVMNGKLSVAADDGTSTPPLSSGIYVGPYQGNTAVGSAWSYSNSGTTYTDFSSRYNNSDSNMRFIMKASATPVYAMTIKGDGRVGIGTTSPNKTLTVYGGNDNGIWIDSQGGQYTSLAFGHNGTEKANIAWDNTNGYTNISTYGNGHLALTTGGGIKAFLNYSGNFGIGTTSPSNKLQVNGDVAIDTTANSRLRFYQGGTFKAGIQSVDTGGQMIGSSAADDLAIRSQSNMLFSTGGNTERMRIDSSGVLSLPNTASSTGGGGSIAHYTNNYMYIKGGTGGLAIGDDGFNTNIYLNNDDSIQFGTSGSERMRITSGGYVGIGNTSGAGARTKLGVTFGVTGNAANLAESVSYAAIEMYPYRNSSTYGMFVGGMGLTSGYIQSANTNGTAAGAFSINPWGGNVGIGTTSPSYKLEVNGGTALVGGGLYVSSDQSVVTTSTYTFRDGVYINNPNSTSAVTTSNSVMSIGASSGNSVNTSLITTGAVGIGTNAPTRQLDVNGEITHQGLVMQPGSNVDRLLTIDKTVSATANTWTSLDISLSNIGGSGTYAVQVYSNAHGSTGASWYSMYWSGIMSWYHSTVNDNDIDEIPLHMAGHARNNNTLELRTKLHTADGSSYANRCELQIKTANTISSAAISFRFRKLL